AYRYLLDAPDVMIQAYGVTITVTVIGSLVGLLLTAMTAYVISRPDYRYNRMTTFYYLHLKDSLLALILPVLLSPFNIMVMKGFMSKIPLEIIESAKMDGAREFRIFFRIILPLSTPALATLGLLISFSYWNDWFNAMLYIDDPGKVPLQLLLVRTLNSIEFLTTNTEFATQLGIDLASFPNNSARMAIAVLAGGPMLIIFPFFQRFFVKGLTEVTQMKKKWFGVLAFILLAATVLAGCGGGKSADGDGESAGSTDVKNESGLKPVELTWYYPLSQLQPDQQKVQDEVNKIVKEKINATVKLMPVSIGDYVQKMNTVLAAGEKFDILWTGYMLKPEELVRKGAIQPLDDLLNQYAPELKSDVPQVMWDGLSVDGKIYGTDFINPQVHDDKYWIVPGLDDHFYIKTDDPTYTLQRYPEEELNNFRLASKWYKEGYIYKDAATVKSGDFKGKIAVDYHIVLKPGVEAEVKARNGGHDVVIIPLSNWFSNGYSATTNQSISRTSPNPDRAMMLLNLVNTDKEL
ncbi:hypothetical protein BGX30_007435, partial [Mortierella sp. GBA39]